MKDSFDTICCVVLVVCALLTGFIVGGNVGKSIEKEKAARAGAARYTVNPASGETTFIYGCIHTNR